ncbi:MAG: hypothetical protein Q9218_006623, partial [Villophora microphyllina]
MSSDAFVTLGHSSPTAIIVTWVLSAFLPLPLIIVVLAFRYSRKSSIGSFLKHPFHKRAASKVFSRQFPSTPSSRTLTPSDDSPRSHHHQVTPSRTGLVDHVCFSPSTPRNSIAKLPESPRTPYASLRTPHSRGSPKDRKIISNDEPRPLSSAFESPKRLGFLESPSLPKTLQKSSYARLASENPLEQSRPETDKRLANPHKLRYRPLKRRCIVSAILFVVILAFYVLEGFTIVAAQRYAHVRVLSQANGLGGLGKGKEDEKWLIPWVVYVVIQGGLVLLCACAVWAMRRKPKQLEEDWTTEKRKGVDRLSKRLSNREPTENVFGDIELQPIKTENERDRLVSSDEDEVQGNTLNKGKGKEKGIEGDEEEEPDWETLGFRPTFESPRLPPEAMLLRPPNPPFANARLHADAVWEDPNPFGEGSSKNSQVYSKSSLEKRLHPSPLPTSFLADEPYHLRSQHQHIDCQDWGLQKNSNEPSKVDKAALAVPSKDKTAAELSNSWAQEKEKTLDAANSEKSQIKPAPPTENPLYEQQQPALILPAPPSLPSGIELDKPYSFIDGLPYPLLPISSRHRNVSKPPTPITPNESQNISEDGNSYVFDMSLPSYMPTPPFTPSHTPPRTPLTNAPQRFRRPAKGKSPANMLNYSLSPQQIPPISPHSNNFIFSSPAYASPARLQRPPLLSPYHSSSSSSIRPQSPPSPLSRSLSARFPKFPSPASKPTFPQP